MIERCERRGNNASLATGDVDMEVASFLYGPVMLSHLPL